MSRNRPRITIAALRGGSGKTVLSLGLIGALREQGLEVTSFKKGPDFIDAGWLSFASGRPCYNLDPFLMNEDQILSSFLRHSEGGELSIVEGNRGLFDGLDVTGRSSTAELAKLLKTPVVLIVDVTMATRTIAAVLLGCRVFDPLLNLAGVILNRVAGRRQENLIRGAVERYCGIPVVGSVPKLKGNPFPERHMGLVPYQERKEAERAVAWAKGIAVDHLDLNRLREIGGSAEGLDFYGKEPVSVERPSPLRVGFIRDKSFWFYYPENLDELKRMGATLVEINALEAEGLPHLDALYIGGGFPETQAEALSANRTFRESLRKEIEEGLPVYAECGGLMFLGECLVLEGKTYPMVGAIPIRFFLEKKPQGHGYTVLEVVGTNPFHPVGRTLRGHEFHYSRPVLTREEGIRFAFKVRRGHGLDGRRDGICKKNLLATYTHIHAAGNPDWAEGILRASRRDKNFPGVQKSG